MPRPKKEVSKCVMLTIRVTAEEHLELQKKALGEDLGPWMVETCLGEEKKAVVGKGPTAILYKGEWRPIETAAANFAAGLRPDRKHHPRCPCMMCKPVAKKEQK